MTYKPIYLFSTKPNAMSLGWNELMLVLLIVLVAMILRYRSKKKEFSTVERPASNRDHQHPTGNGNLNRNPPNFESRKSDFRTDFHGSKNQFSNTFSKDQKCAVVISLTLVAQADGDLDDREKGYIGAIAKSLSITLEDVLTARAGIKSFDHDQAQTFEYVMHYLNTLTEGQKEWYVVTLDRMATDSEMNFAGLLLTGIGMTPERYGAIVEKAAHLEKLFL